MAQPGAPMAQPGAPMAWPGAPTARTGVPTARPGSPAARTATPPQAPGRRGAGKPGAPSRRALPPLPRSRAVTLKEVPGIIRQLPQHKPWMVAIGAITIVVIVAVCSFGSFMLVKDDNAVVGAPATPATSLIKRDITSRETDPNPMTAADVFPAAEIIADPNFPPYKRIGEVQAATDCRVGASGEVGKLLLTHQCNQVVRASFSAPDGKYFVTGGVFNLPDAAIAATFATDAKALIDARQGTITGYISDPAVNVALGRAPPRLVWEVRGHFLIYTVIVKVDGSKFEPDDAGAKVIIYDILQQYLRNKVIEEWSVEKTPPSVSTSLSPSA
jgi:hypothetical protein